MTHSRYPDIAFEGAFLRAGLLVGLVHERDVPQWGAAVISRGDRNLATLSDVLTAPIELTAMREALRPFAEKSDDSLIWNALLTALRLGSSRSANDVIGVLRRVRCELPVSDEVADSIKTFEDRMMLAGAGIEVAGRPDVSEIDRWLTSVATRAWFFFVFDDTREAAAFVAAVSRKLHRDRAFAEPADYHEPQAILVEQPGEAPCCIALNETAWVVAEREFSPLPVSSRIPYVSAMPRGRDLLADSPMSFGELSWCVPPGS
jgi:hypothetical protein